MFDLTGRVVLVTGGNSGIGLGMAEGVAAAGADVAIWGRRAAKNDEAAERLRASGRRVEGFECDIGDEEQVVSAFAATVEAFGKVDCLIANAGIAGGAPFHLAPLEEWRRVLAVNLEGSMLCLREASRHMIERGEGGSLVTVSSISAIDGAPFTQAYAASKAGLLAITRGLAVELARHRIRVNAVLPGWIDTPMNDRSNAPERLVENTTKRTPVRRWGEPADFAKVAVYLADPTNLFHTGDTLVVDGGYTVF